MVSSKTKTVTQNPEPLTQNLEPNNMKTTYPIIKCAAFFLALILLDALPALATQTHGEPEGLYMHQMAHLFFIFSMGVLEFWLRQRNLVREPGWKYIQVAAVLFILWNLDTFMVHYLAEQVDILRMTTLDVWHKEITYAEGYRSFALFYYFGKLDHLLCVPAMFFMYLGLKTILKNTEPSEKAINKT